MILLNRYIVNKSFIYFGYLLIMLYIVYTVHCWSYTTLGLGSGPWATVSVLFDAHKLNKIKEQNVCSSETL